MGGDNEVCILHTDISRGMTDLNKDVGIVWTAGALQIVYVDTKKVAARWRE